MRELRTCDFCAADAVGTFEIVPPELEPTEAEQRRVVCCPDCRDRLETLLEPLLVRLGIADSDATDDSRPTHDSVVTAADSATTRSRPASANSNATVTDVPTDETAAFDTSETDHADNEGDTDASESDPDADASDPNADEADADAPNLEGGITLERDEQSDDTGADPADATDSADTPPSSASPPRAYSKVVRLLRNREFPMQRRAVEDLAAGAYDLESDEVEAIVEYAIEDGEFVENRGELRRP
ncbi:hypothetical protein [Natrinema limicola]|uniref:Uncharacterized protein n=1 Tax=Natrinema limicola JCM 13563 TaxID=1230457 RepID=M0C9R5_9EURY|nr:hypothetical protein [Natrinema limicola]ELZ19087.1 hypothetical protein C476_12828 [Natrinema limicola JCM 13563]